MKAIRVNQWEKVGPNTPAFGDQATRVAVPTMGTPAVIVLDRGWIYTYQDGAGWYRTHPDYAVQVRS